jgi:hypothetical protein
MHSPSASVKRPNITELRQTCPFKDISDTGVKVWEALSSDPFQGEELIKALSRYMPDVGQSMGYSNEYSRHPGKANELQGREHGPCYSYSIEYHIVRVLEQAAKYEVDVDGKLRFPKPFLEELCMAYQKGESEIHRYILDAKRIADVMHDVGKPNHWHTGDTQHVGTIKAFTDIQSDLPLDEQQKRLTCALMRDDSIGLYLQHEEKLRDGELSPEDKKELYNLARAAKAIVATAAEAGLSPTVFLGLKIPCYIHDASSYTQDAGPHPGSHPLDRVFLFETDHESGLSKLAFSHEECRPRLAANQETDLARLKEEVARISGD